MTHSWWLKFNRAIEHQAAVEQIITRITTEADNSIRIEKELVDGEWAYRLRYDVGSDETLPVIIGDFLFNLRSALDHIVAANMAKPSSKSQFPIFHEDFLATTPAEPPRFKNYRKTWKDLESQLPRAVFVSVELAQPFVVCRITGTDPAEAALSILNELQNRDKHSSLGVVSTGVTNSVGYIIEKSGQRIPIRYPTLTSTAMVPNRTQIFGSTEELDVRFTGNVALAVVAGPNARHRPLPMSFADLTREVEAVLQVIERNMP
jgi:hypothetical protein